MTFKKKMFDSKIFITSYTERGIVIREEIRVGNSSASNSASKKNCLIMADKSSTLVIFNKEDYIAEVKRQLNNSKHYTKLNHDSSSSILSNIFKCID
jgi:hypothetical protein